jgi:hypothetical protein
MSAPLSDRERLARELKRWDKASGFDGDDTAYKEEADRILSMLGKGKK